MPTVELVIPKRPVSQQARRRERVREWKELVAAHALDTVGPKHRLATGPVALRLLYLYDDVVLDVDNILKPIFDALSGVLFIDDAAVTDVEIRRRSRRTAFTFTALSPVLAAALDLDREFLHVALSDSPRQDLLP